MNQNRCLVFECMEATGGGNPLCRRCYAMLRTGEIPRGGTSFIHKLRDTVDALARELELQHA